MSVARAFARAEDGTETDITEGVQALYDLVISSMDFRSGFWTVEDAVPVAVIARLLKFKQAEEIERYLRTSSTTGSSRSSSPGGRTRRRTVRC